MDKLFKMSSVFICLIAMFLLYVMSSTADTYANNDRVTELRSVDIEVDGDVLSEVFNEFDINTTERWNEIFPYIEYIYTPENNDSKNDRIQVLFIDEVKLYNSLNKISTGIIIRYHKATIGVATLFYTDVLKLPIAAS